jgi:AAA+ ATPase superfamily predicted ATPase
MNAKFFNREKERLTLKRVLESNRSELFIIYGRRGVGKSALLQEVLRKQKVPSMYYRATRRTLAFQLSSLTEALRDAFTEEYLGGSLASLDEFLSFITSLADKRSKAKNKMPVIVTLDELPYLSEVDPGLLTTIQHWWDDNKRRTNIKLFLSGSHLSFMEKEVLDVAAPLYNRRTGAMKLEALDYYDSALFFPNYSIVDKITAYSILGGMPSYLEQFNSQLSVEHNVKEQVLRERTYLSEEPEWLLLADLRKDITYGSILRAIAQGARKPSDIARAIGKDSAQDVAGALATLQELGLVVREVPITDKLKPKSRNSLYLIADQYLDFWYRHIDPSRSLISRQMGDSLWNKSIAKGLDQHISHPTFERVSRQYMWRALRAKKLPKGLEFVDVGNWWGDRDVEIDLVAINEKQKVTAVGSCKWTNALVDVSAYSSLSKAVVRADWEFENLWYFLFSKSGFTSALKDIASKNNKIILVTLKQLFEV